MIDTDTQTQILLVSPNFVKNVSNIDDNISGKLLEPAIFEAQNESLRGILGDNLEDTLEYLFDSGEIDQPENQKYKTLLIKCQYFLAYTTISNVCMLTAVKISNAGLEQVSDEKMEPLDINDSFRLQAFYQHKADYFALQIQNFLLQHRNEYPELSQDKLHSIKSNLYGSASTGIWLGGVRGRSHKGWYSTWNRRHRRDGYDY